jgi:hypothetical protein
VWHLCHKDTKAKFETISQWLYFSLFDDILHIEEAKV